MFGVSAPWLVLALVLGVGGGALYALADGTLQALSLGLIGLAVVVAVSAVFYAVGISEDRDRERRR